MQREVHEDMVGWTETEREQKNIYIKRRKALKIQAARWRQGKSLVTEKEKLLGSKTLKKIFMYFGGCRC